MNPSIDILYLTMAAFGVLGIIEWIKSLIAAIESKDRKALGWVCLSLVLSFIVAAAGDGGIWQVLTNAILILAFNELVGYNMIVKTVFALIDRLTGGPVASGNILPRWKVVDTIETIAGGGSQPNPPPAAVSPPATGSVSPLSLGKGQP
jgi:hypothetical protein